MNQIVYYGFFIIPELIFIWVLMFKLEKFRKMSKSGFTLKIGLKSSYKNIAIIFVLLMIVMIAFILFQTGVIKLLIPENNNANNQEMVSKNEITSVATFHMENSSNLEPIADKKEPKYVEVTEWYTSLPFIMFCFGLLPFIIALISVVNILLNYKKHDTLTISYKEYKEFVETRFEDLKLDIDISKTYITKKNLTAGVTIQYKDYVNGVMSYKRFGDGFFIKRIFLRAFTYVYNSPQFSEIIFNDDKSKMMVSDNVTLASKFSNNKEYMMFVIASMQTNISTLYNYDKGLFERKFEQYFN
ncbi:hypothetical protein H9M94_01545 [Mycoplasma sp. Pen4]|uniref:hypothetical protein n=1 Tax=Mycoplasma sp. Pen4 TaxID=640330 RepID=UPI0016542E2F|nr:hypothetical protein [Mycoplasma sp. Pen4]QNM93938.1 hypothetical protein H9M94_01545 [Mycoplasma sp. Pen4]